MLTQEFHLWALRRPRLAQMSCIMVYRKIVMNKVGLTMSKLPVRRVGRFLAVLAIALGAGHLVQTEAARKVHTEVASVSQPIKIVELSATPDDSGVISALRYPVIKPVLKAPEVSAHFVEVPQADATKGCDAQLDLSVSDGAMLNLALLSPCDPGARVVLATGGLTVTGRLDDTGQLAAALPALDAAGHVQARFADGRRVEAQMPVPELAGLRRFAVQWLGPEGFILHGFENGADFGQAGDVSPSSPGALNTGAAAGGWLTLLGDSAVNNPLLAQVYTFPAEGHADVVVEAEVTAANCGKDMLGQTIASVAGQPEVTDLTLAMPDCSAVGDFLVLKNLAQDTKLASR